MRLDIRGRSIIGRNGHPTLDILFSHIAQSTDASPESPVWTTRTPRPTSSNSDGQMIKPEAEDGSKDTNAKAKQNIKTVMSEIKPAGGCYEYGEAEWCHSNDQEIDRGSCCLTTQGLDAGVICDA